MRGYDTSNWRDAMTMETLATVENGLLRPHQVLPFPDHSQVRLTIDAEWNVDRAREAWMRLKNLFQVQPLTIGLRFSRDELHERD